MRKGFLIVLLSAIVGGLTSYAVVKVMAVNSVEIVQTADGGGAQFRTVNLMQDNWPDFTFAAETAVDAVVYVKVTSTQTIQQAPNSIFEYFFGFPQGGSAPQQRERVGSGSGVIIREDGYIVTNNHVIDDATKIEVTLNNNQTYQATLVGTDPATDIALLKIDATGLPMIPFGDSDNLRLGEWVIAIGSPYDLRSTITAGIVSAKGRSMPNYTGEFKIESFIQTDAAVNPGNSGGALVNIRGELVGINTAIYSETGSYSGYSFAVPVNIVKKIVADLQKKNNKNGVRYISDTIFVCRGRRFSTSRCIWSFHGIHKCIPYKLIYYILCRNGLIRSVKAEGINAFPTFRVTPALNFPITLEISYFIVGNGFIRSVISIIKCI